MPNQPAKLIMLCVLAATGTACQHRPKAEDSPAKTGLMLSVPAVADLPELIARAKAQGLEVLQPTAGLRVDLRYAGPRNRSGRAFYPPNLPCLLHQGTKARLDRVLINLKAQGLGLLIWDAWRPSEVQETLYAATAGSGLFLNPKRGWSRHCAGVSLDATLTDAQGRPLPMPCDFDGDLALASSLHPPADPQQAQNLWVLHQAMRAEGLIPLPGEWWHFDDADYLYTPTPIVSAEQLGLRLTTPSGPAASAAAPPAPAPGG